MQPIKCTYKQTMIEAAEWLCDAPKGSDQKERGDALKKAIAAVDAAVWQACLVQGLLGFDASTTPDQVIDKIKKLLNGHKS